MLKPALRRLMSSVVHWLRQPSFWEWLSGLILLGTLMAALVLIAVSRYDTYLRLNPLLCSEGMADRQFFIVAMAAPVSLLFMLVAVGEFWEQRDRYRAGRPVRWLHLSLFFGLAVGLAALVLLALQC